MILYLFKSRDVSRLFYFKIAIIPSNYLSKFIILSMKRLHPIICLLVFFNIGAVSQITCDFNSNCKKTMKLLYQFKLNQATTLIEQEEKTNPDNLASTYLRHYNLFLSFITSQDNNSYEKLNSGIEKILST